MTAPQATDTTATAPGTAPVLRQTGVAMSFIADGLRDYHIHVRMYEVHDEPSIEVGCAELTLDEWAGEPGTAAIDDYYSGDEIRERMYALRDRIVAALRPIIVDIKAAIHPPTTT
jgi:hypothetical protein